MPDDSKRLPIPDGVPVLGLAPFAKQAAFEQKLREELQAGTISADEANKKRQDFNQANTPQKKTTGSTASRRPIVIAQDDGVTEVTTAAAAENSTSPLPTISEETEEKIDEEITNDDTDDDTADFETGYTTPREKTEEEQREFEAQKAALDAKIAARVAQKTKPAVADNNPLSADPSDSKPEHEDEKSMTPNGNSAPKKHSPIYDQFFLNGLQPLPSGAHFQMAKNLYSALELNHNLALAAAGQADRAAFSRLKDASDTIAALENRIATRMEELKAEEKSAPEETLQWLGKIISKYKLLREEMNEIQQSPKTKFRYFFTKVQETTNQNEFQLWLSKTRSELGIYGAHARSGDGIFDNTKVYTQNTNVTDNVYRLYPPTPNSNESALYEHEYKIDGHPQYEVSLIDLPEQMSDRYLLAKFLCDKGVVGVKDEKGNDLTTPEGKPRRATIPEIAAMISKAKLPATLTASDVIAFLQREGIQIGSLTTYQRFANQFINKMDITRTDPISTSMLSRDVRIPNQIVFNEAKRMLDTIVAHGQFPVYFDQAGNKQLMRAIDILVQLHGDKLKDEHGRTLKDKIFITAYIPKDFRYDLSQAPEEVIAKLQDKKYQLSTLNEADNAISTANQATNSITSPQPAGIDAEDKQPSNSSSPRGRM